jgi:hypothetical protein
MRSELSALAEELMTDFRRNSRVLDMNYKKWGRMQIQCIYPRESKVILDRIDSVLARHFGLTERELDFIVNYDIKYRLGREDDVS